MKIAVLGLGYVGTSMSVLLSEKYDVVGYDIDKKKVDSIDELVSPVKDEYMSKHIKRRKRLSSTHNVKTAIEGADYIFIATPTNYDDENDSFNLESIFSSLKNIDKYNREAVVVIKSTVPIGFTKKMREEYRELKILFSPEFLREGSALYDNHYPSRIIVGDEKGSELALRVAKLMSSCSLNEKDNIIITGTTEAEAVKLFANTYLAMRVSFFNELDSFCEVNELLSEDVIKGVCFDSRIGNVYNNPSFGYGGYCLPKDTKQLRANFKGIDNSIIEAVVDSNYKRKEFIAQRILSKSPKTVGIYRLNMKKDSDNFKSAAIIDIIEILISRGVDIVVYEPTYLEEEFNGLKVFKNIDEFKSTSDVIVSNRYSEELSDVRDKIYTRDVFNRD